MKIAIIQPRISYYPGGGEKTQILFSKYLALHGHSVDLYTIKTPEGDKSYLYRNLLKLKLRNLTCREIRVPKKYLYIFKQQPGEDRNRWDSESLLFNQLIFDELNKNTPDILICSYLLDGIFRPTNIPALLFLAGYPIDKLTIRKSFLRFFDATVSISRNVKKKWGVYLKEVKNNYILNKGVEINKNNIKFNSPYPINIVFAGRLLKRKGVITLIKSINNVRVSYPQIHLWIIGDGPQKEELVQIIKKYHMQTNVTLTGFVENIDCYYLMADICIFPSYAKEGLMGTVLEAMVLEKAVITTTNNGNEDVIKNNINGVLVEPKDVKKLSDSIIYLLKEDQVRANIGKKAKEFVIKHFDWDKIIERYIKILEKTIIQNKLLSDEDK